MALVKITWMGREPRANKSPGIIRRTLRAAAEPTELNKLNPDQNALD
jgi:hypothetical protein